MAFIEFFGHLLTSILIGYLALTNSLADIVSRLIDDSISAPPSITATVSEPKHENTSVQASVSEELRLLSQKLASSLTSVPRVLLENQDFQQAALGASALGDAVSPATNTLPVSEQIEQSLVNIFCQYKTEQYIRTTTGTGFFINQKGIILTNAHVAQFLLLKESDSNVIDAECVVRTGNPAVPSYKAELLYISPMWIYQNASLITEEMPRGTGERDYALLYVSSAVGGMSLPESFPSILTDTSLLSIYTQGINVYTAGYPAESLFREGARAKLAPVIASTTVGELYTFGSNYADVFAVSESPVGAQGASGGPVARTDGSVIGLIVTKGNEVTEGSHSLRAITLSYIDRTITEETGFSLLQNMQGDLQYRSSVFKKALVPFLRELLTSKILSGGIPQGE